MCLNKGTLEYLWKMKFKDKFIWGQNKSLTPHTGFHKRCFFMNFLKILLLLEILQKNKHHQNSIFHEPSEIPEFVVICACLRRGQEDMCLQRSTKIKSSICKLLNTTSRKYGSNGTQQIIVTEYFYRVKNLTFYGRNMIIFMYLC